MYAQKKKSEKLCQLECDSDVSFVKVKQFKIVIWLYISVCVRLLTIHYKLAHLAFLKKDMAGILIFAFFPRHPEHEESYPGYLGSNITNMYIKLTLLNLEGKSSGKIAFTRNECYTVTLLTKQESFSIQTVWTLSQTTNIYFLFWKSCLSDSESN